MDSVWNYNYIKWSWVELGCDNMIILAPKLRGFVFVRSWVYAENQHITCQTSTIFMQNLKKFRPLGHGIKMTPKFQL